MEITFNLPHAFSVETSRVANAYTLEALLKCLVSINVQYLREYPNTPSLYKSGVRYGRTIIWEPIPALYLANKRKVFGKYYGPTDFGGAQIGDCKSLAPARIAELIISGRKARPVFRFKPRPDGLLDFHILILTDNGYEEDPSRVLGMK
jgi:hypothetical protein